MAGRRLLAKRFLVFTLATSIAVSSTGCSLFASGRQTITITTDPPDAEIMVNGEYYGASPAHVRVRRKQDSTIMVRKKGYRSGVRSTSTGLSGVGIVDVIGGCIWLVPFLGLLSGGAYKQEPSNIAIVLQPEES